MANYFTNFSFCVDLPTQEAQDYALALASMAAGSFDLEAEELPSDLPPSLAASLRTLEYVNWDFIAETSSEGNGIWLRSGEGDSVDVVCLFVQHLLQQFIPAGRVTFEWSRDCSRPRIDAYGGGAAVITAGEIKIMSTSQWLKEQPGANAD